MEKKYIYSLHRNFFFFHSQKKKKIEPVTFKHSMESMSQFIKTTKVKHIELTKRKQTKR